MTTKLTWYGHAALGLETGGFKVIVDPFLEGILPLPPHLIRSMQITSS